MVLCGTKNVSSMASLEETFEAPLFLRVQGIKYTEDEELNKGQVSIINANEELN